MTDDWKKVAAEAWSAPSWKEAAAQYRQSRAGRLLIVETEATHLRLLRGRMSDKISLERTCAEISRAARERYNSAPEATYKATHYELRTHGIGQLGKPNCQRRLSDLSVAQLKTLMTSLQRCRGQYPNVSDALLAALAEIYDARTGPDE